MRACRLRALPVLILIAVASIAQGQPDLTVSAVDVSALAIDAQSLAMSGVVAATIVNLGAAGTGAAFEVAFFQDVDLDGAFDGMVDDLLGTTTPGPLGAGQSVQASITVSSVALFADAPVQVLVDSAGAVTESDEGNNLARSGTDCGFLGPTGAFSPQLEWQWSGSSTQPAAINVLSTPAVCDLDGDGVPEVIFGSTASTSGSDLQPGVLRVVRGDTGAEVFTVASPPVNAATSVAVGDIDGDGSPEIVTRSGSGTEIVVFEHDGALKWTSPPLEDFGREGGPAIADLDADGSPEIVSGRQVLDAGGTLLWTGAAGAGASPGFSTSSTAVPIDVDLDGTLEVVAGNTVYSAAGAVVWQAPLPDGYNAVANFDADSFPEIVLVTGGNVYLLEHDGSLAWGPVAISGVRGGPPTIADYDGDGLPEIGVAGATAYTVIEHDGQVKWTAVTQDGSSAVTGSSVFDFEGDGAAEVVYRDELFLRVYAGATGAVLFQIPVSSCTWIEYVLVADVDADGNAEILASANTNCGFGPQQGILVFGDANDGWAPTRPIWNEHAYHVTNVAGNGAIPVGEDPHWLTPGAAPINSFRQNRVLLAGGIPAAPDLSAGFLRFDGCRLTARIGNGGAVPVGPVPVSFYDGDPAAGGSLLAFASTSGTLVPGAFEDVSVIAAPADPAAPVFVVADDAGGFGGTQNECDEADNVHSAVAPPPTSPGVGQANGPLASLVVDCIDAGATAGPFSRTLTTPTALSLEWGGPAGAGFLLFTGLPNAGGTDLSAFGYGIIDIGLPPTYSDVAVLLDGTTFPGSLVFRLDALGRASQTFSLPPVVQGLTLGLQGAVAQPSATPAPVVFTAAWFVTLQ